MICHCSFSNCCFIPDFFKWYRRNISWILNNEDDCMKAETSGTKTNKLFSFSSKPFDPDYQPNGLAIILVNNQMLSCLRKICCKTQHQSTVHWKEWQEGTWSWGFWRWCSYKSISRERCSTVVHVTKPRPNCRFIYDRIEDKVPCLLILWSYSNFPFLMSVRSIAFCFLIFVV